MKNDYQLRQSIKSHSSSDYLEHYYLEWYLGKDIRYHIYLGYIQRLSPQVTESDHIKLIQTFKVEDALGITSKRRQGYRGVVNRYIKLECNTNITQTITESQQQRQNLITIGSYTAKHLALTKLTHDFWGDNQDWLSQLDPALVGSTEFDF